MKHYTPKQISIVISTFFMSLIMLMPINLCASDFNVESWLSVKSPGNNATQHQLKSVKSDIPTYDYRLDTGSDVPMLIYRKTQEDGNLQHIELLLVALDDICFNYGERSSIGMSHNNCLFYMPGFWYRRNLRSPGQSPSFHVADSWTVREDRLSCPLTAIYDETSGQSISVMRTDAIKQDALMAVKEGEVILSDRTDIGFTGFENCNGVATLTYGFPFKETPHSYVRKLTLAPSVKAFHKMNKGESLTLTWTLRTSKSDSYSDFIKNTWEYCYDSFTPTIVENVPTVDEMKAVMSGYFLSSYVDSQVLIYTSGAELRTDDCVSVGYAEIGFLGRVLLNAFNAWEYGNAHNIDRLKSNSQNILNSYLSKGFTPGGFFREHINYGTGIETDVYSIRRQSEGVYGILHYLDYEKQNGRKHPEWENRMRQLLDRIIELQNTDGSFPRKFRDDKSIVDGSGGSTPSATLPLVMAYKYFGDKRYLESAKRSADYLEKEIISKADYFSSTLDAYCEDKEASLYAATATYYLALVTKGDEQRHYANLSKTAAYFALSWYYLWDVPFAQGQMLGDLKLKSRGWGNVSVENNHIDVFVFEFADVLRWLAKYHGEDRFAAMADVTFTSMRQLLPTTDRLCGIAKPGYYPEVVQHTYWDYGKNGKGFYNTYFAPGWTVASLWELMTPGRTENFLLRKR